MAFVPKDGSTSGEIDIAQVKSPADIAKEAALQLVVQDAYRTKSWIESRYFNIRWVECDMLYQSPPSIKTWEGTGVPRANISKFTVATHINAINSKLIGGLFYEEPPFMLRADPGTTADTARAISIVQADQLDLMGFKQEVKYGMFSCLLNGTGIWKYGWKEYYESYTDYKPVAEPIQYTDPISNKTTEIDTVESDLFTITEEERLIARPFFEACDIRSVLVDPGCRVPDIRKAKFVIHEFFVTYKDLMKMKDEVYQDAAGKVQHRYDLPDEAEIKSWFDTPSAAANVAPIAQNLNAANNANYIQHAAPLYEKTTQDPLEQPLEMLERWDNDKVITVLQQRKVIRNEPNPFRKIPFYSVCWWMIQDCFWGIGLGTALGGEQRLQQGFINAVADIGTLAANQPIIRSRGANINTQQMRARLGGFVDVDGDVMKALHPMDLPKIQSEMFSIVQASESRTEDSSGASNQFTMGSATKRGQGGALRTATGAGGMMQAAIDRIGGLAEDFVRQVYQPFLWQMYEMNKKFLPATVYRRILGDKLGPEYRASIKNFMLSGVESFDVLAGSHLATKQQMAQSLPLIMQYFTNPALAEQVADINGEFIEFKELLHMLTDSSGWGGGQFYSIFKPLTDEMKKARGAKQNPIQQKTAAQAQLNEQKSKLRQNELQQEWTQRAAGDVIRHSIEASSSAVTGVPGGPGFGGAELPG